MAPEEIREAGAEAERLRASIGLTDPRALALERFPIRTREDGVTRSAWRLRIACAEGEGAIVWLDSGAEQAHFRGEGVFLGWPRERLEAAYHALRPVDDSPAFELTQLG
ncbi:MAG TPA: hypothetical protein VGH97_14015 [Thermoanaerobaculia bacterium]|jgi:hypothetical protein